MERDSKPSSEFGAGTVVLCLIFLLSGKAEGDSVKDYEIALAKGQYEIELRNYGPAIEHLKKALELKPGEPGAMLALGIAYSRNEEYLPAKELLQKVYTEDPKNTRAQYELGVVLAHLKEYGEANRLLATVTAAVATAELADNAKELMEGMKPQKRTDELVVKIAGGLQYDSNVILEPDKPFAPQNRKSDWRAILSLYGSYPFLKTERRGFSAKYQFYQSLHYELEDYNVQQHDLSLVGQYTFSPSVQGALQMGYVISSVGGENYSSLARVRPTVSTVLMPDSRTQFSVAWEDRRYVNSADFPTNSYRSGSAAMAGVSHTQMFTKETHAVLEYGYELTDAEKDHWDAAGHKLSISAKSEFGRYTAFANAGFSDWQYGPSPVPQYPDRHDQRWDGTVGIYRDVSRTMRVSLANQYVVNDSNLDVYKYRRDIMGLFVEIRL